MREGEERPERKRKQEEGEGRGERGWRIRERDTRHEMLLRQVDVQVFPLRDYDQ